MTFCSLGQLNFSTQKGVKGLPLHIQIDTYEDPRLEVGAPASHRGYCQVLCTVTNMFRYYNKNVKGLFSFEAFRMACLQKIFVVVPCIFCLNYNKQRFELVYVRLCPNDLFLSLWVSNRTLCVYTQTMWFYTETICFCNLTSCVSNYLRLYLSYLCHTL